MTQNCMPLSMRIFGIGIPENPIFNTLLILREKEKHGWSILEIMSKKLLCFRTAYKHTHTLTEYYIQRDRRSCAHSVGKSPVQSVSPDHLLPSPQLFSFTRGFYVYSLVSHPILLHEVVVYRSKINIDITQKSCTTPWVEMMFFNGLKQRRRTMHYTRIVHQLSLN